MALTIVWTDEAKAGLHEIVEYLENHWTEKELLAFFTRLEHCLEKIKDAPHRHKTQRENPEQKNTNILLKQLSFILMTMKPFIS